MVFREGIEMNSTKAKVLTTVLATILLLSTAHAQLLKIPEVSRDKVICFALYTVGNNIMKMTAQLYPLKDGEDRIVRLEIKQDGRWKQTAQTQVVERGWTAVFRVENWDSAKDIEYRVAHGKNAYYTGIIRKDPVDKNTIVVAAFTGNSINPRHGGETRSMTITGIMPPGSNSAETLEISFAIPRRLQYLTTTTLVRPICGVRAESYRILVPVMMEGTLRPSSTSKKLNVPKPAICPTHTTRLQ